MTTIDGYDLTRHVYFHDPLAPAASAVVPSAFVAVRWSGGRILLVRRCDSGGWELPGGRVDVGETAVEAAVRETAEEAGVRVRVTGLAGIFSDPGHVIRSVKGEVRQQFALLFRARAIGGMPHPDLRETSEAAWVTLSDLARLPLESHVRLWIDQALDEHAPPYLA